MKAEYCHEAVSALRITSACLFDLTSGTETYSSHSLDISVEIWTIYRATVIVVYRFLRADFCSGKDIPA